MFELTVEAKVARLALSRPQARNAISLSGWDELAEKVGEAEAAQVRAILVQGSGSAFCAGADLVDFKGMKGDAAACADFRRRMRRGLERLRETALPTIALVQGPCYGAGVALAMACDMRAAGSEATFAITPAKMGISYPQEDVHALVALVGPGQAARLLFSGRPIDAREARRIGLADLDADDVPALIEAVFGNDAASLAVLKRGIRQALSGVRSDAAQDASFDALLGSDGLARRLAERQKR